MSKRTLATLLRTGGVAVIPTDTIYGLVGSALMPKTVARIYRLRKRNTRKPMITLIGALADLKRFGIRLSPNDYSLMARLWPGKVSVVLPCRSKKFSYLHRGKNSIAFRLPAKESLRKLLKVTGPLVAPSANVEGRPLSETIAEAKKYFGNKIDFYVDGGELSGPPSTLVAFKNGRAETLRRGAKKVRGLKR